MPIVKFYAGLRKAAGVRETTVSAPTLHAVLDCLAAQFPSLQQHVWDGNTLRPHVVITVNGHALDGAEGLNLPVEPEDEIAIFPPIAGG
jgi:molybdopterin synthase sulfur carrier subunit